MDICSNYPTTPSFHNRREKKKAWHTYLAKVPADGSIQQGFITDNMKDAEAILDGIFQKLGQRWDRHL